MMFGLSEVLLDQFRAIFSGFPALEKVLIYGSRAREDAANGSDIDLAIIAPHLQAGDYTALWNRLDELPHIFKCDLVWLDKLDNDALKSNILRDGKEIYPWVS